MIAKHAIMFLEKLKTKYPDQNLYVAIPVPEGPGIKEIEEFLQEIRDMGYGGYVRTSEFYDEIVVTDLVENDDS